MTIMVVAPGHSIHTKRFVEALLLNGHRVVGVCRGNPYPAGRDGFRYSIQPRPRPGSIFIHSMLDKILGYRVVDKMIIRGTGLWLWALWVRFRPHVTHLLWLDGMANVCLSAGLRPLVLNCWGSDINRHFKPGADPYLRELCRQALLGADLIICDTLDTIEKCNKIAGTAIESVLLHLGVDTEAFSPGSPEIRRMWRDRLDIPMDARVLASMRAWHPMYGHHLILEAFSRACKRISKEAFLLFKTYNEENYPDNQGYEETLRQRAEELGISEKIRWLEVVSYDELPGHYAMCDIVVNYPEMDTLGITLLEAASCKRPIITCNLPGYQGTFVEKYAKLVSRGDQKELEDAIVEAVNEPVKEDDPVLEKARCELEEYYSYNSFSQKLEAINKRLASTL